MYTHRYHVLNSRVIIEKGFYALTRLFASESWDFCHGRLCPKSLSKYILDMLSKIVQTFVIKVNSYIFNNLQAF